jgi:hypothetical protein
LAFSTAFIVISVNIKTADDVPFVVNVVGVVEWHAYSFIRNLIYEVGNRQVNYAPMAAVKCSDVRVERAVGYLRAAEAARQVILGLRGQLQAFVVHPVFPCGEVAVLTP